MRRIGQPFVEVPRVCDRGFTNASFDTSPMDLPALRDPLVGQRAHGRRLRRWDPLNFQVLQSKSLTEHDPTGSIRSWNRLMEWAHGMDWVIVAFSVGILV